MFHLPGILSRSRNVLPFGETFSAYRFQKSKLVKARYPAFSSYFRSLSTWARYNRHYGRNNINWGLLKKPGIFTVSFCLASTFVIPYAMDLSFLSYFKSHPRSLVYAIIGLNCVGFLAWRRPETSRFMARYCLLFKDNIRSQWSLLGSSFSHRDPIHLMFNMLMLYSFGASFVLVVGASNFLVMYLNSAVVSSFVSIAIPVLTRTSLSVASLGASGALFGMFGAFASLFPKAAVSLFFIPVPGGAWVLFLASIAVNAAGIALKWGRYDYAAHLGGSLVGAAYGWYFSTKGRSTASSNTYRAY